MRNLKTIRHGVCPLPAEPTSACWDVSKDEVLVSIGPTEEEAKIDLFRVAGPATSTSSVLELQKIASWDAPCPNPALAVDKVLDLHHFGDSLTTCLVLAGGDIYLIRESEFAESPADGLHIEIVGSIDAGITAACWSPDEELLVITTAAAGVIFMSRTFDPVTEVSMTPDDLAASKHVSVGWGKKETQFQGRGAKALRDPTIPEKVDEGKPSVNEDGRTTISWRGDGAYVAINAVDLVTRRAVRVYSREGILDSVSEPVDGFEGSLSWRPAGNLLAGIQRFPDHVDVVFFERNGLRHGHFTLRCQSSVTYVDERIGLEWNSDSTVLAVVLKDRTQLWTMGNYHWYLKQEVMAASPAALSWHPEKPLRLAVAGTSDVLLKEYVFSIARGSLIPPHDHGAVAVIDGRSAKLTPLRTANIPPPMSMFELTTSSTVVDVAFAPENSAVAVLHQTGVDIYAWQTKGTKSTAPKCLNKLVFAEHGFQDGEVVMQICFAGHDDYQVLVSEDGIPKLARFRFDAGANKYIQVSSVPSSMVSTISPLLYKGSNATFKQDNSGKLSLTADANSGQDIAKFPLLLPWVEAQERSGAMLAFGLSRNGHLYANSRLLTRNCTSFLLTPEHLVFTTNNHLVKFVHLADAETLEVPPDDPENDERCRSIERGAKLVTAIPTNMSIVLQMPRGNLETIYPRAMVVAGIRRLIDVMDYTKAFGSCRTQRVDMNILYDHNPAQFLANVGLVLDQLRDVASVDLFLSSLKEEDVTVAMYKDTKHPGLGNNHDDQLPDATFKHKGREESKINTVCDAVLKNLLLRKSTNLQNIITAHVCKAPPALDDGLLVVAELMQEDEAMAERAAEHICFLVDVNRLYDHALGLYNLDLALLIAQQSQRDPREYLPFIQDLHQKPDLRRKFAIDDHLGHREKALSHLYSLKVFDEVQRYTTKHSLYNKALGLCRYDADQHRAITELFAEYLQSQSQYREAGLAYESLGHFGQATTCYRAAGPSSWRECLFAAQQQEPPLPGDALANLASALAEALNEAKDYVCAATIQLEYLDSLETAVRWLCKGAHFAEAQRLVASRGRADLLQSTFDPALADALSATTELLADFKAQLRAQVPRIAELRAKAEKDPLAFYEGERGADIPDDVSVATSRASTGASLFTRYTGSAGSGTLDSKASRATSRNRKREEKKRARGRKGTVYEEEYLVNSVRRLVERVQGVRGEVENLVSALWRRGMAERARAVEAFMAEVVDACRAAVREVWPAAERAVAAVEMVEGGEAGEYGYRPSGADAVLQEALDLQKTKQEPPVIADFKRLSLLG